MLGLHLSRNFRRKRFCAICGQTRCLQKDKFSSKDKNYMKIAINLAIARKGLTGENPSRLSIVKLDKIISVGQTGFDGRPHAQNKYNKQFLRKTKGF